jgi:hypothetical protein
MPVLYPFKNPALQIISANQPIRLSLKVACPKSYRAIIFAMAKRSSLFENSNAGRIAAWLVEIDAGAQRGG